MMVIHVYEVGLTSEESSRGSSKEDSRRSSDEDSSRRSSKEDRPVLLSRKMPYDINHIIV
jgi:hypothetical protein